jgi:hypothetical protein
MIIKTKGGTECLLVELDVFLGATLAAWRRLRVGLSPICFALARSHTGSIPSACGLRPLPPRAANKPKKRLPQCRQTSTEPQDKGTFFQIK